MGEAVRFRERNGAMKNFSLAVASIVLLAAGARAQEPPAGNPDLLAKWVHPGNEFIEQEGYDGAETCVQCHPEALTEIVDTVHWNLASPVRNVQGLPDGSWWGMVNRQCALAGTTSASNWVAATEGKASVQASGCGVCHIGSLPSPPMPGRPVTQAEIGTVDCLVCHAEDYDWTKRATLVHDARGTHWGEDTSVTAALSVTRTSTNEACLRCHEHSLSQDYKRGDPYTPDNDVHAKAGLSCVTCHTVEHHKIAKGLYESDMVANDLPDVAVSCSSCHGGTPHRGGQGEALNLHASRIACQTCHVPEVSGIVLEDWSKPVKDDVHGAYSELSRYDRIPAIPGLYVPMNVIAKGHPSYIWRVPNVEAAKDAQSWMAFATVTRARPGARIFPVRGLTQIMLFDQKLKMADAPGMGFLKDDPQMAQFPLLLAPNREVYNQTGDVKASIDAGMRPFEAMGLQWSGQWMGMQVPGTSYISVNHGIKATGLSCDACHSGHGVMDFGALGYSPEQVERLETPRP